MSSTHRRSFAVLSGGLALAALALPMQAALQPAAAALTPAHNEQVALVNGTDKQLLAKSHINGTAAVSSADGRYVVFSTDAALVPADKNGIDDVYRRDTIANDFVRITSAAVEPGVDGRVRVLDSISPFQADGYRIVALTRDNEPVAGGSLDVEVGACGRVLGESQRPTQVLLVLGLVAAAMVSVRVRRRRSSVPK